MCIGGWKQLLQSVSGGPVSVPMTIVISGIAKMFVGELVEMGITRYPQTLECAVSTCYF